MRSRKLTDDGDEVGGAVDAVSDVAEVVAPDAASLLCVGGGLPAGGASAARAGLDAREVRVSESAAQDRCLRAKILMSLSEAARGAAAIS
jgi:hypothetical protein